MLELPHVNILSKMDLIKDSVSKKQLRRFVEPDPTLLDDEDASRMWQTSSISKGGTKDMSAARSIMTGVSFDRLNHAVAHLIEDFSMVSFLKLDVQKEDSVGAILSYIDDAIQYHEAQEPREPNDEIDFDYDMNSG